MENAEGLNNEQLHWFAAKIFFNKTKPVEKELITCGIDFFTPSKFVSSLLFIHTTEQYINTFRHTHYQQLWVYTHTNSTTPAIIPDREMQTFIFVCTSGEQGLMFLGDDKPEYHIGDKVRVIDGPFKGIEGHVRRIKKDRRVVISINGIAAIATTFIPPTFLEAIP